MQLHPMYVASNINFLGVFFLFSHDMGNLSAEQHKFTHPFAYLACHLVNEFFLKYVS